MPHSSACSSFVENDLATYGKQRNHPEVDGTSRMSPYLHFGQISPLTIALAVDKAAKEGRFPRLRATAISTS